MKQPLINLQQWTAKIGWPGTLGIGLLVFSVVFFVVGIIPERQRFESLRSEIETLRARNGLALTNEETTPSRLAQLQTFYEFFPALATVPAWLSKIHSAAETRGLHLEKGDYKLIRENDQKLARYQITFPVKGSYQQIRTFVNDVLSAAPAAALEDITLKREGVGNPVLDAEIKVTLYVGVS